MKSRLFILLTCALGIAAPYGMANQTLSDVVTESEGDGVYATAQMNLKRWGNTEFYENTVKLIQDLSASHGPERAFVLLEIAELYLSQAMTSESLSILKDFSDSNFSPESKQKKQELLDAIRILNGRQLVDPISSTLLTGKRPDSSFWITLHAIVAGDAAVLFETIGVALDEIDHLPPQLVRLALPALIEALIEIGDFELAQKELRKLVGFSEFQSSPAVEFLKGRLLELQNDQKSALDHYVLAAGGWDRYAARARFRLSDMAIKNGSPGALVAASEILNIGINAWRGDQLALRTLQMLAKVNHLSHQTFEALLTNNKIILRFPNSEEAIQAEILAASDLELLYQQGANGEFSLSEWHAMHLRLIPAYRHLSIFAKSTEIFADSVLKLGATTLAIVEYERAIELRLNDHENRQIQSEKIISIQLKIVGALMMSGRTIDARDLLVQIPTPQQVGLKNQLGELTALVMSNIGEPENTLNASTQDPTALFLRKIAFASWSIKQWPTAVSGYRRLWTQYPEQFGLEDATYMLIAAHKNGDSLTGNALVKKFPELTSSSSLTELAQGLLEKPAEIFPLRSNGAHARITSANRTLEHIDAGDK